MNRARFLDLWRATGADLPGGDPRPSHGAEMEGYFWRFTDVSTGRVVVALCGVNRHPAGDWATVAVAAHPGGVVYAAAVDGAAADRRRFHVRAADVFEATDEWLHVRLGGCEVDARLTQPFGWPLALGGGGVFSAVPFLNQYWHPHVLGAEVRGRALVDGEEWPLDGATAYAEKNWGKGFPERWWWGQAQGFDRPDVCVAFSGGVLALGRLRATVGGAVVRVGDDVVRITPPLARVGTSQGDGRWRVVARNATASVVIDGDANGTEPHVLPVPLPAERRNVDTDFEHLAGRVTVALRRRGRLVYEGTSELAGLETGSRP